jgi:ATP/maltotriose-dependent transcriptional regulator MalT
MARTGRGRTPGTVGREAELALLSAFTNDLLTGRGAAVLVEGEPGVGKTELVREATARAEEHGNLVLWGAGDELAGPLLLSPLLEALSITPVADDEHRRAIGRLLGGAAPAESSDDLTTAIGEQMLALVAAAAADAPTVLVIDDLHWCDAGTLAVWVRLAKMAASLPLLLIGTVRQPPNDRRVLALERAAGHLIELVPLTATPVRELVGQLTGGTPTPTLLDLTADAGGNPLYITELVAALERNGSLSADDSGRIDLAKPHVPSSLTQTMAARIDVLPAGVRTLLRQAALLGTEFALTDLAVIADRPPAEIDVALAAARDAGILADEEPAFRHPLLRTVLYEDMPPDQRLTLHRAAAHSLAMVGTPPERVAQQLLPTVGVEDAEPFPDWAASWLRDAAPLLQRRAPETAVRLLEAVVRHPSRRRTELAVRLASALMWAGSMTEAEEVALRHLRSATSPADAVELLSTVAQCHITGGRPTESIPLVKKTLRRTDLRPDHRARLLAIHARLHLNLGKTEVARRIAESVLTETGADGDEFAMGWAYHVLTVHSLLQGEVKRSLPMFDRALIVTERDPALADLRLLLRVNHTVALGNLDRFPEAIAAAREVCAHTERIGSARQAQMQTVLGEMLLETGEWDDALHAVSVVPDELKEPAGACCDLGVAALVHLHRGELDKAREHLEAAGTAESLLGGRVVRSLALARAQQHEIAGEPEAALEGLMTALTSSAEELEEIEGLLPDAVRIALELGRSRTAEDVTDHVERIAKEAETPHYAADALYCRGLRDADATLLLEAESQFRSMGRVLSRAAAARAAGDAFAAGGARLEARRAFLRAAEVYEDLGASWDLAALNAHMRQHGIRRGPRARHRRSRSGWEGLTPGEHRVVELLVQGLSNAQIGSELFLSPRTVETHVSHVLAKLGLRTRLDVAREASLRASAS